MERAYTFTIFGGTGDLTYRKLLPALYNISVSGQLPGFRVVIIGRREYGHEEYCSIVKDWMKKFVRLPYRDQAFEEFCSRLSYFRMDFTDEGAYEGLHRFYEEQGMDRHIFYFAVAPRFFSAIAKGLTHVAGAREGRVVIEKPFGEDLQSARELNRQLEDFFTADRVYHIDHYLGKEMVRNIQAIRFLNPIFAHIWNHEFIENVQISAMEEVGVETRGSYYDHSGALKDMVQNHLFQILSIVAMDPAEEPAGDPAAGSEVNPAAELKGEPTAKQKAEPAGSDMRQRQLEVLKSLRKVEELSVRDTMVLGQYFGYQREPAVAPDSETETYAALRLFIDNDRWQGTPFYIRTGKKLNQRQMEVVITFKSPGPEVEPDVLIIKIQPTEGVYVRFNIKKPGNTDEIAPASMDFCQSCLDINKINTPEAYERLLMSVVKEEGDWFSKWEQIEVSWEYIDRLKEKFKEEKAGLAVYGAGSGGPEEAEELLRRHGHRWWREEE